MRIMCFGYSQTASYWYEELRRSSGETSCAASVRTAEKATALRSNNIDPHLWHEEGGWSNGGVRTLEQAEIVLISAPPQVAVGKASTNREKHADRLFASIAPILLHSSHLKWLGYLSSTNVYGNHNGAWVNESTPCTPTGKRGVLRLEAEQPWRTSGLPAHTFRLAGIYGPKRNQLRKLQRGKARRLMKPVHVFNRIHEADIAQTLNASLASPDPGRVYKLADDHPAPPQDVLGYSARLLGCALPEVEDYATAPLTGLAAEFYWDNKRVCNHRIKTELGVNLRYPDYRTGLYDALNPS